MAIQPYVACQPDEPSLEAADVVNVLRKRSDGKIYKPYICKSLDRYIDELNGDCKDVYVLFKLT